MKKISLMKIIKTSFLVVAFLLMANATKTYAASRPDSITIGNLTWLDDYLGYEVDFNYKQTSKGTVIYCLEYPKDVPTTGMTLNYNSVADAGLTYIMQNGYPNKKFTGDNKKDYFVTQVAVWLYLGQSTTGLDLIKRDMGTKSGTMYTALNNLVNGANKAKAAGYATSSMKLDITSDKLVLSSDSKYYVSKEIGITSSNLNGNYKVTLNNAPKGTLVQTVSGSNSSEFAPNTKFVVKVPVESIKELTTSFSASVSASSSVGKTYIYSTGNSNYQKMIVSTIYSDNKDYNDKVNFNITTDKVVVNKVDSQTKKNISGATLAIKNSEGKVVEKWKSTTESHIITNLPDGKYVLYEVEAPQGYQKTDKTYEFTVSNKGKENSVTIENIELVHTAQVEISKQDVTTKKELPGATLEIKDSKGKVVETWVSTDKPHYVTLEVGKYTLTETVAPDGYVLSKETIEFEITKNTKDIVKKVMFNTPVEPEPTPEPTPDEPEIVDVPKTDVNSSVFYGLTAGISAIGYGLMRKFGKKIG